MIPSKIIIFANGLIEDIAKAREFARTASCIICADGGAVHCHRLGILPHVVVGDMDSIPCDVYEEFRDQGVMFEKFPVDKDFTDLELALDYCRVKNLPGATIHIFAALGGRWDMSLATIFLLARRGPKENPIVVHGARQTIQALRPGEYYFNGVVGQSISFLPLMGSVENFTVTGLRYPAKEITLEQGTGRGVSNAFVAPRCRVKFTTGVLLMIVEEKEEYL